MSNTANLTNLYVAAFWIGWLIVAVGVVMILWGIAKRATGRNNLLRRHWVFTRRDASVGVASPPALLLDVLGAPVDPLDRERDLIVTNNDLTGTYTASVREVRDARGFPIQGPYPWDLGWGGDCIISVNLIAGDSARLRLIQFDPMAETAHLRKDSGDENPYPFALVGLGNLTRCLDVLPDSQPEWNVLIVTVRIRRVDPNPQWRDWSLRLSFRNDQPTEKGEWVQDSGLLR